jgi:hypothetical protein
MTAPPRRAEVTNPARHGPEFPTGIAFNIRNLPRCVMPFCFTRSYSERCVRRRVFGKENEPADAILSGILYRTPLDLKISRFKSTLRAVGAGCATSVQKKSSTGIRGKTSQKKIPAIYCPGDSAGDSCVAAGASVAAGLVSVAPGAMVGAGVSAGVTVSVFCSHAARSAAPARMQMYFFIVGDAYCFNRSIAASAVFGPRMLLETQMAHGQH